MQVTAEKGSRAFERDLCVGEGVSWNEVTCSWFYRLTDILSGGPDATENLWLHLLLE